MIHNKSMRNNSLPEELLREIVVYLTSIVHIGNAQIVCKRWHNCIAQTFLDNPERLEKLWLERPPFYKSHINMYTLAGGKKVFRVEPSVEMCMPLRILHSAFKCQFCDRWHVFKYQYAFKCPKTGRRAKMPKPFLRTRALYCNHGEKKVDNHQLLLDGLRRRHMGNSCPHVRLKKKMRVSKETFFSTAIL